MRTRIPRITSILATLSMLTCTVMPAYAVDDTSTPSSEPTVSATQDATPMQQAEVATPQPQSTVQANPQTPPTTSDITIHDTLNSDSARVSSLKITNITSGTAPYDSDDSAGNDSNATNTIIRSFDTATYTLQAVTTSDNPMDYYKTAYLGIRVHIPTSMSATIRDNTVGWAEQQTQAYKPTITSTSTETIYTYYRRLEPTSATPTSVPGTYELSIPIYIQNMVQGDQFTPTFDAWLDHNTESRYAHATPTTLTVSSRPQFNVRIANDWQEYQSAGGRNTWDFTTADGDARFFPSDTLNSELGKQKGLMTMLMWDVEMRADNPAKGVKGIEYPKPDTPITFNITVQNDLQLLKGGTKQEAAFQPYYYMMYSADKEQNTTRWNNLSQAWTPRYDTSKFPDVWKQTATTNNSSTIYNGGHMQVNQQRGDKQTTFTITVHDWQVKTGKFPKQVINGTGSCSSLLMADATSCDEYQRMIITGGRFFYFTPTDVDGQVATKIYNDSITITQTATTPTIQATGMSGQATTTQSDTTDDRASIGQLIEPDGGMNMNTMYACATQPWVNTQYNGLDCGGWRSSDATHGTDKSYPDHDVRIRLGSQFSASNQASLSPVASVSLLKFDDKILEFDSDDLQLISTSDRTITDPWGEWTKNGGGAIVQNTASKPIIQYAVKPDGTGWVSDKEQATTRMDALNYYDTLAEAKQHGTPVAIRFITRDAAPSHDVNMFFQPVFTMHVRADAPIGQTAQITQEAHMWTRGDLEGHNVLPDGLTADSSREDWQEWVKTVNVLDLAKTVPFTYNDYADNYVKSTYTADGDYVAGTEGDRYGDTMLVAGEKDTLTVTTSQAEGGKNYGKTVYDLDREERAVDWQIPVRISSVTPTQMTTTVNVDVTIPNGMTYQDNSAYWDGKYTENTPSAGTVTGGQALTPVRTGTNANGTVYRFTIENVPVDSNVRHYLYLTGIIGDAMNPETDAKNGQSYTLYAQVTSTRDMQPPTSENQKYAYHTVRVSRTRASQLATRAVPLLNDVDSVLGFTSMAANSAQTSKSDVIVVDQLPVSGSYGSSFHGSYSVSGLTLEPTGVDLNGNVRVFISTSPKYQTVDPATITVGELESSAFIEAVVNENGVVDLPASVDASKISVIAGRVSELPAGSKLSLHVSLQPSGNQPTDLYVNRFTDMDNTVSAMASIVDRVVNGIVFVDSDKDGARSDSDKRLSGVKVQLVSKLTPTIPITLLNGESATTVTDENGYYEFTHIPAGTNYQLVFTPANTTDWAYYATTLKQAPNIPTNINSDGNPTTTNTLLTNATITLNTMPPTSSMTTSRYVDSHEDVGLITIASQQTMPYTGSVPWLLILLGVGTLTMICASIILLRKH